MRSSARAAVARWILRPSAAEEASAAKTASDRETAQRIEADRVLEIDKALFSADVAMLRAGIRPPRRKDD